MRVVVTGGAGFIGSFVVRELIEQGHEALAIDDLSTGHLESLDVSCTVLDCGSARAVSRILASFEAEAVIHLASLSQVGESVSHPGKYWRRNVGCTAGLLEACRQTGVERIVLSSSAAVYGDPERLPIEEDHRLVPSNPYGATKLAMERMLEDFGMTAVSLRYFNAAGAERDGSHGEDHDPETHLIPLAFAAARSKTPLQVFGDDYPTPDGTCVRDYVHVRDLAVAHILALDWAEAHRGRRIALNLGSGRGATVREVIDGVSEVAGTEVPTRICARRDGDPASLVAGARRAREELGWSARHSELREILQDAWAWHASHPRGYAAHRAATAS